MGSEFQKMVRLLTLFISLWLLGGLVGCNAPANPLPVPTTILATQILGEATHTAEPKPRPSATPQPEAAPSQTPSATLLSVKNQTPSPTSDRLCNLASAGKPIDITIPDNARMDPGESFVKTWRLVNAGSCDWTRGFAAVWFSGINLSPRQEESLRAVVAPDQSVDISVDMSAPESAGIYQSNWKLRDEKGNLFGIGPVGNSPFWVRIEVVAVDTPTSGAPALSQTPVPVVRYSGFSRLSEDEKFDLDSGTVGPGAGDDLLLKVSGDQFEWIPQNGARVTVFGVTAPSPLECRALDVPASQVLFTSELAGQYLCVITDQNLPGSVQLSKIDLAKSTIDIRYVIWEAP